MFGFLRRDGNQFLYDTIGTGGTCIPEPINITMFRNFPTFFKRMAILLFSVFLIQCDDEEPQHAAKLNVSLSLFSNAAIQGKITFNEAIARVSQITVSATNPSQDVLTFSKSFSDDQMAIPLLRTNPSEYLIELDARKNKYEPFNITLTLEDDHHSLQFIPAGEDEPAIPDLTDYFQNAKPALMISGRFDNRGKAIPVHVAITDVYPLKVTGSQYGTPQVRLDKENLAELTINPAYLFQNITTLRLESAQKVMHSGQETIFIHPQFNTDLLNELLTRLEDTNNSMALKVSITKSSGD
jgi:hypothetical protein